MSLSYKLSKIATKLGIRGNGKAIFCPECNNQLYWPKGEYEAIYCKTCGFSHDIVDAAYYCSCCGRMTKINQYIWKINDNRTRNLCEVCKIEAGILDVCQCCGHTYVFGDGKKSTNLRMCAKCELKEIENEIDDYVDCIKPKEVLTCKVCGKEFKSINNKKVCDFCRD